MFQIVDAAFSLYTLILFVRIVASWIPEIQRWELMRYIYQLTEPYLGFFRRVIPPLGMFDLSPIVALFTLGILRGLILNFLSGL